MALGLFVATSGNGLVAVGSVIVLGLVAMPFLRVFMHSQGHWKAGNGPIRNFILDHGLSLLFGLSQTGYKYGHLAHHRYDNDYDPTGFPKDLQSTYIFSRNRKPTNIWVWCVFYILVYQQFIHMFHAFNAPKRREALWFVIETAMIIAFNMALFAWVPAFYLAVYLPSLLLAWFVSAVSLYMMHAIDLDDYDVHPTLNTSDKLFNWFGDNDGYHMEHSLFPALHPVFLEMTSRLINPPEEQVLKGQYFTAAFDRMFAFTRRRKETVVESNAALPRIARDSASKSDSPNMLTAKAA